METEFQRELEPGIHYSLVTVDELYCLARFTVHSLFYDNVKSRVGPITNSIAVAIY